MTQAGRGRLLLAGIPLLFCLLVGGGTLLRGGEEVLSLPGTDIQLQFAPMRAFSSREAGGGRLPLWNPALYGGIPALGNPQMAQLYPPHLLFLVLPLGWALNLTILLHLALAGMGMGFWARSLGAGTVPAALAGVLLMGSGPLLARLFAGQLTILCVMSWAPLLLLACDRMVEGQGGRRWRWALAGVFAGAMMLLAGHPQTLLILGAGAAAYALAGWWRNGRRVGALGALATVPAGSLALGAWQWVATLQAVSGSAREGKLPLRLAGHFSLPPENLLSLLTPFPMGGAPGGVEYWGQGYIWEMTLFLGVTSLVMAPLALKGEGASRNRALAALSLLALLLALGRHTPLFRLLYDYWPGFGAFRGHAKWALLISLFLPPLAALGVSRFLRSPASFPRLPRVCAWAALATGAAGAAGWVLAAGGVPGWWRGLLRHQGEGRENYLFNLLTSLHPDLPSLTLEAASRGVLLAALTLSLLAVLTGLARRRPRFAWGVVGLALLEAALFSRSFHASFPLAEVSFPQVEALRRFDPGDYRVLAPGLPNSGMATGVPDAWGYDPFVPRRYALFMARAAGVAPDTLPVDIPVGFGLPRLDLLRVRYAVERGAEGEVDVWGPFPHLPHALVVPGHVVAGGEDEAVGLLFSEGFDPWRQVVLEEEPLLPPGPGATPAPARVEAVSTDELVVEAEADGPAILLLTDQYNPGWRAEALPNSAQRSYRVLRGDAFLTAIPVGPGRHRLRLVFDPPAVRWGRAVSLTSLALFLALAMVFLLPRRPSRQAGTREAML